MGAVVRRPRDVVRELPRRQHDLPRRTVVESQRWRLLEGIIEAVAKLGYAQATVADAIAIAGVSRKTFYEQFRDKEHCFLAAFEAVGERLLGFIILAGEEQPAGPARRRAQLARFLQGLANDPLGARVFLLDALGAGRKAWRMRQQLGAKFGRALLGEDSDVIESAAIVGGINAVVRARLLDGDTAELPALTDELAAFVERARRR